MKFSPLAFYITLVLHSIVLVYLLFPFHNLKKSNSSVIQVSIPVSVPLLNPEKKNTDSTESANQSIFLSIPAMDEPSVDPDRYYLPQELSQQLVVLAENASTSTVPVYHPAIVAIYVNENGTVDAVQFEEKGTLTNEQMEQLDSAFKSLVFLPGMRGTKVVKALYRIQVKVNRFIVIQR